MQQAGIPPDGALTLLEYFADQELGGGTPPAYALTHPLASDRLEALRRAVESSPLHGRPMPAGYDAMFARMQAKLYGFLWPQQVVGRYPASDTSLNAEYARAIAAYRQGVFGEAVTRMNTLLAATPNDPYFQELAGQMLLESGRLADARPHYERALSLKPGEPLFLIPLAQTKIDAGDLTGAIRDLEHAALDETAPSLTYRLLATAYGMQGDIGIAASYLAVEALRRGDKRGATEQATRAMQLVARGTPAWFRAEDIIDSLRAAGG
jgi:predicted Zn-dependent protease